MRSLSRIAVLFGAPALLLLAVSVAAWLMVASTETGLGPMRLTPLPSPTPTLAADELDSPSPTQLMRMSPLEARIKNALLPFARTATGAALSHQPLLTETDALECLTQAIYYEAGRESETGKRAVAQVIVNRSLTAPFPNTICGVVQQGAPRPGCQFTFMCDGSLARRPDPQLWMDARRIAAAALGGATEPLVGGATHYHADYVFPTWAPAMVKLAKIGAHIFYRWPTAMVRPPPPTVPLPEPETATPPTSSLIEAEPLVPNQQPPLTVSAAPTGQVDQATPLGEISEAPRSANGPQRDAPERTPMPPPNRPAAPQPFHERRAIPNRPLNGIPL